MSSQYTPFKLGTFSSEMNKSGIHIPAYFVVMITLPPTLVSTYPEFASSIPLRIEAATIPDRTILTHDQRYYGPPRKIPYGYATQPFAMSVILSEDMREREIFMRWQDLMVGNARQDPSSRTAQFDGGYYDDATKNASVEVLTYATSAKFQTTSPVTTVSLVTEIKNIATAVGLDPTIITRPYGFDLFKGMNDRVIDSAYKIKLMEPFPISINEVPVNWSNGSEYSRMIVQMQYRYAIEENIFSGSDSSVRGGVLSRAAEYLRKAERFAPIVSMVKKTLPTHGILGSV